MDKRYTCYCGLYCENCATKAKVEPAARVLYDELKKAGFEDIMPYLPGGEAFWPFLENMAVGGTCDSCREGSGNPGCEVRICAKEKGVEMCALCTEYPCDYFTAFFEGYTMLKEDNALLREQGIGAWARLQDERKADGYAYSDHRGQQEGK